MSDYIKCDGKQCGLGKHLSGGRYVCPHNNLAAKFPNLALEWDYERNTFRPEDITTGSDKIVWWICLTEHCGCHRWQASISNRARVKNGRGCPYCSGRETCIHTSLYTVRPDIALEWDYEKNGDIKPWNVAPCSNKKYWWICLINPCGCHKWEIDPNNRMSGNNCPFCCNQQVCIHSSLYTKYPQLMLEWDYERNIYFPWTVSTHSKYKFWWICKINPTHRWEAYSYNRIDHDSGCPTCAIAGFSKAQIKWIKEMESNYGITIRHALSEGGEFKISEIGKVDGYCLETNTVYEYHGDYWHGNPLKYNSESINEVNGITFGELYRRTMERDMNIRLLGYNLITKWTTESILIVEII